MPAGQPAPAGAVEVVNDGTPMPIDAAALVRSSCEAFAALAAERRVTLRCATPTTLGADADSETLGTVVAQLLFNAFKSVPRGGAIDCEVALDDARGEFVLRVTDTGPGAPSARADAIFDQARQSHSSVFAGVEGVGLGLHASRDLMTLHGGTLALERPGSGCTAFEARWPALERGEATVAAGTPAPARLAARAAEVAGRELAIEESLETRAVVRDGTSLVAVISGDRCLQRLVIESLEPEFSVAAVLGPEAAPARLSELRPDLVLLDARGIAHEDVEPLVDALRTGLHPPGFPLVVLADQNDAMAAVRLLERGVQDVLSRPLLLPELRARVRNLVANKRAADLLGVTIGRQETDLVSLATRVSQHQQELERALQEGEQARRAAEAASRVKSNFLRIMSHELKTPITSMQLYMRLIEQDELMAVVPRLQEIMPRLARSSKRLVHLVDTMLAWARVESGRVELVLDSIDLAEVIARVVDEFEPYARHKGISLDVRVDGPTPPVVNDRRLLQLLIVNLVSRAFEVTGQGGIELVIGSSAGEVRLTVRDHGPGLQLAQREELFDALGAVSDLSRRSGPGSGLGLHVVRDLARALGGDLSLEDGDWPGGSVTLTLPLEPRRPQPAPATDSRPIA